MAGAAECFLSPKKLRTFFTCVCFGAVFVWILHGSYLDAEDEGLQLHGRRPMTHYRRLLAVSTAMNDTIPLASNGSTGGGKVVHYSKDDECSDVHNLASNVSKCIFIRTVDSCQNSDGLMNYLEFIYCILPSNLIPLGMVILFAWLLFLFIFLGATAEEYFCPALKVMSQVLRLSQNVAISSSSHSWYMSAAVYGYIEPGVTFLALGNGAPDIFSAFAAINQRDDKKASLAVGALFGAGMFVTTIVVGAVTISKPFTLTQRPFLRDIIFYMGAVYWTFFLLWRGSVDIGNAIGFVALYIFYVVVVIMGRLGYQKWKKLRRNGRIGTGDIPKPPVAPEGRELGESEPGETAGSIVPSPAPVTVPVSVEGGGVTQGLINSLGEPEIVKIPRQYRVTSIGSSEFSNSEHVSRPVIFVADAEEDEEEEEGEKKPLLSTPTEVQQGPRDFGGVSRPGLPIPAALLAPDRRRGASIGPPQRPSYGSISKREDGSVNYSSSTGCDSPGTAHKQMRRTISGALDITEEVGAAVGIPHVAKIWEEVHRGHHSNRHASRSRSHSRSVIIEEPEEEEEEKEEIPESQEDETAPLLRLKKPKRPNPFVKMLQGIWPFGSSFRELGILGKIYEVFKSPASILLSLTVPVIDRDEDDHNWNKWLNVLHCVTAPVFIALITKTGLYNIGGVFPVWTLVLILGTLVGIVVACTSRSDTPPVYHCVYAWVGFAVAVVWIYSIANEIVNLLQVFGVVIRLSDGILGLTLLAWGNSIGDAVSNVTMARQGFPRMAIGACFGGPLLNMLLGIGIASVVKSIRRPGLQFSLYFTQVEFLATIFLLASLACSLVVITCLQFRLKRLYGVFLLAFYVVFLVVSCIAEAKVFTISIPGVITDSQ